MIAAGAVIAISAVVGTGFVLQSTVDAEHKRVVATSRLTASTGLHAEQLGSHSAVLAAQAELKARTAIADGNAAVAAAAAGKTDASALATSVAQLANYTLLAPERVFQLAGQTQTATASVTAAVAEADRVAAEQAAAAAAAAAAAKAAADAEAASERSAAPAPAARPSAPSNPSEAQAIARDMMAARYGWGDDQFGCLVSLWNRESGWNVNSYNASSGAGGIPQALPASKMASAGADWQTNPATQISWGLGYISGRWGTPCAAWDHSESSGWY
ncbi:hypothetical protein WDJ51_15075 [Rathayibacter sp. YIM 133350]|uniref:aggregation-promoting factor C-terminal-like domain-containing protein n=1 Tax=Rathayibacter sp. YIM 133350 TaxID=3131992 RepID=UPI00307E17CB